MNEKNHHIEMIQEGQMNIFEAEYQAKKLEAVKMVEQAMEKLQTELRAEGVHPYISAIGNFLLDFLKDNPTAAEKIMAKDKTIVGSMRAMRKVAEKQKVDNCAVLTPEQGYNAVLDYFDIKSTGIKPVIKSPTPVIQNEVSKESNDVSKTVSAPRFEASLDEFL